MSKNGATEEAQAQPRYTLVRYEDGTEQLALARVGDVVAFEIAHDRTPVYNRPSDVLWLVWRSLGKPHDDFQAWADSVIEFSGNEAEIEAAKARAAVDVPPTEPVAATGGEKSPE